MRIEDRWKCLLTSDHFVGDTPPQVLLETQRLSSGHCCSLVTSGAGCSPSCVAGCSLCRTSACLASDVSQPEQLVGSH